MYAMAWWLVTWAQAALYSWELNLITFRCGLNPLHKKGPLYSEANYIAVAMVLERHVVE